MDKWLERPDSTHAVREALQVSVLAAIVELLVPRAARKKLGRTPVVRRRGWPRLGRKTTNCYTVKVQLVQLIQAGQIPVGIAGDTVISLCSLRNHGEDRSSPRVSPRPAKIAPAFAFTTSITGRDGATRNRGHQKRPAMAIPASCARSIVSGRLARDPNRPRIRAVASSVVMRSSDCRRPESPLPVARLGQRLCRPRPEHPQLPDDGSAPESVGTSQLTTWVPQLIGVLVCIRAYMPCSGA